MKQFLKNILVFSLLVLVTLTAAELYVRHLPNPSRDKHQWMLQHSTQVTTLVLGNSHAFYGVNPALLGPSAYSLAQVSQTYRYDDYLLHHYPFPRLKTVLLPFSYFSLYEDFEQQANWFDAIRYRLYMDCDLHSPLSRYGFECMSKATFTEKLKSLWQPSKLVWNSRGFGIYKRADRASNWDNGAVRAQNNTYPTTALAACNEQFLNNIFSYCQRRHIRVVWFVPPVRPSFYHGESPAQRRFNAAVCRKFLAQYPNVAFVDAEQSPLFTADDFYDGDHLNTTGAGKLTRLLHAAL